MKVLVCGGRGYDDFARVCEVLGDEVGTERDLCLIEGGASGADALARTWAEANGVPVMEFPANWKLHGKSAGPVRNLAMLNFGKPDRVIAFPGGRGTAHIVDAAECRLIPVLKVTP